MSRRHILTERQRSVMLDLPTDDLSLLKHYTLGDDDLENIEQPADRRTGSVLPCNFAHCEIRALHWLRAR